jgi:AmmeMemoRadiSam system protein A
MANRVEELELSPVLYRNSGDSKIGDKDRVVGYWAIAGSEKQAEQQAFNLSGQEKESLLEISRSTLESFIKTGTLTEITPGSLSPPLKVPAGAFVSLYMGGRLRGCIGSFSPTDPLYAVVESMTLAAALKDSRFVPVEEPELEYIDIEISVLTPLQKISSIDEFELGKHGIYMIKDDQSGTFLPQVADDSGWNTEEFLGHCARDKAGIGWDGWKEADLYIYEAVIFSEKREQ